MSKYITHFQTEAAYQAALPNLDLPNVSLVDEFNEVHYHRALYNAHAGDICLYDVAEGQKIFVASADWNLTDYPTASYPIVGVAVTNESTNGVIVVSNKLVNTDGSPGISVDNKFAWQTTINVDWGLTKYTVPTEIENDNNGKSNTNTIIAALHAYDTQHSTDNFNGTVADIITKFHVDGTVAGDWYIPSGGEAVLLLTNFSAIGTSLNKIYNTSTSLGCDANTIIKGGNIWTSTEYSGSYAWVKWGNNTNRSYQYKVDFQYVRPFILI